MATTQKQSKEEGKWGGRYKGKKKGNMQDTDVRMEADMQETCQKCILCQGYATSALTQGVIRTPLPK